MRVHGLKIERCSTSFPQAPGSLGSSFLGEVRQHALSGAYSAVLCRGVIMPAPAPRGVQAVRLRRAPPRRVANAAHVRVRGRADLGFWPLALIAMIYVLYVPVGPALIYNELVSGPSNLSEKLPQIWSGGRYIAALAVAPALLMARGVRPLARCWPAFAFAIFAAASIAWSAVPKESMRRSLDLFTVMVITSTLVSWCGLVGFGRKAQIITGLLMIASLLVAILVPRLGVHHAYDLAQSVQAGRWRGIFLHKNALGGIAVTSIVYGFRSIRHETGPWKAFFIAARICSVVCCLMAGSAGAWGAALVAVAFFMLMRNRATANPIALVAMTLIGGALLQGLSLSQGQLAEALGRDTTFSGRTEIWALGRSMIQHHLLFGSGLGTDGAIFGAVAQRQLFDSAVDLHSGYLDVLFNLGLVGAALMIGAVGAAMLRGYAYTQTHSGEERDQAVIFLTLVVAACANATAEITPFQALGSGAIGLWTALPALYQLGSGRPRSKLRPHSTTRAAAL